MEEIKKAKCRRRNWNNIVIIFRPYFIYRKKIIYFLFKNEVCQLQETKNANRNVLFSKLTESLYYNSISQKIVLAKFRAFGKKSKKNINFEANLSFNANLKNFLTLCSSNYDFINACSLKWKAENIPDFAS